ncbi:DNA-binding protein [Knoellia sinensis KCTC 19936]|uniref:Ribonuclease VapC n=1 Tax=Knoellia sinensis KCTC 19936 TaxID=1385520 RepID=A0A0A0JAR6_9MICO|nr:TA system VapC family ribonuclease toxin [Knoellia sinensis]KGN33894.1 DNA-binding protein [Knoellia sinensis KCTC 19936]
MIVFDVNVFVYAIDNVSTHHAEARDVLQSSLGGSETVAILEPTLVSMARIVTHHRLMATPLSPEDALEFCEAVRGAPAALPSPPTPRAWGYFHDLVTRLGMRGSDLSDVWLAAQAQALGARFVTFDRGFRRFAELDVRILGTRPAGPALGSDA